MKTRRHLYYGLIAAVSIVISCKQTYNPPALSANKNYLVVDGYINAGSDSTVFTLTRTSKLDTTAPPEPEAGAQLMVEGDKGYSNPLPFLGNGRYGINGLNLDNSQNYRLRIITSNGTIYLSDFQTIKSSPPIDSISWQLSDTGVQINVNSHDPSNNTHYYRWSYTETWEYHSPYNSYFQYNPSDSSITILPVSDAFSVCWGSDMPTSILIASTAKLSQDLVYQQPLVFIPSSSEKMTVEYTILVKQYALTADEFSYWETLKNTTEQTGTLFDQQPTQITGNIHCITNPGEPVIGFIGVGAVAEKRIFISSAQVSHFWNYSPDCMATTATRDEIPYDYNILGLVPVSTTLPPGTYVLASRYCLYCKLGGRSDVKPPFWP